jgi:inositol transport system ATP-binding protein
MGSGRTEIMQSIFGIDPTSSGKVFLEGQSIKVRSTKDAIKNKIAMVTEDRLRRGVIHKLSVKINMSLVYLSSICKFDFIKSKTELTDCQKWSNQ